MLIDIRGFNPENLGSCLMLLAARSRLAQAFPAARISVALGTDDLRLARQARERFGVIGRWPRRWKRLDVSWLGQVVPEHMQNAFAVTRDQDFRAVVDLSGFAYGDFWGAGKLQRRLGRDIAQLKREGRKVILLPQAFGPFKDGALAQGMRTVLENADLVFPRDRVSREFLSALDSSRPLEQFPDFTHEVPAVSAPDDPADGTYVCIIPNSKLTVGKDPAEVARYLDFFVAATHKLTRELRVDAVMLRFGGAEDAKLVETLMSRLDPKPRCFLVDDARHAKGLIANSVATVSSRFHAIMSALGAGVPCLSVGWSHKYGEAMGEYDSAPYSLSIADLADPAALDAFVDEVRAGTLRERLVSAGERQRAATDRMWDRVVDCIREAA
jgi:polysaccharide pyruvyl transferase WcaK-like protein